MTTQDKIEAALEILRRRYVERDNFLSDDDLLDAADEVAPFDHDAVDAGDLAAIAAQAEHYVIVDILFEQLTEADA